MDNKGFIELLDGRTAESLGNNELIDALSLIPDISEALGEMEDKLDTAKFLGLAEEIVNLYNQSITK